MDNNINSVPVGGINFSFLGCYCASSPLLKRDLKGMFSLVWFNMSVQHRSSDKRTSPLPPCQGGRLRISLHYHPRVPADLGYYDLRVPEVRIQQAKMVKETGIEGFCCWHYWFAGRRLLDSFFTYIYIDFFRKDL